MLIDLRYTIFCGCESDSGLLQLTYLVLISMKGRYVITGDFHAKIKHSLVNKRTRGRCAEGSRGGRKQ